MLKKLKCSNKICSKYSSVTAITSSWETPRPFLGTQRGSSFLPGVMDMVLAPWRVRYYGRLVGWFQCLKKLVTWSHANLGFVHLPYGIGLFTMLWSHSPKKRGIVNLASTNRQNAFTLPGAQGVEATAPNSSWLKQPRLCTFESDIVMINVDGDRASKRGWPSNYIQGMIRYYKCHYKKFYWEWIPWRSNSNKYWPWMTVAPMSLSHLWRSTLTS